MDHSTPARREQGGLAIQRFPVSNVAVQEAAMSNSGRVFWCAWGVVTAAVVVLAWNFMGGLRF